MLFFNRFDKNSESPPVKTTVKSSNSWIYWLITPSISEITPFITPDWIDLFVSVPINSLSLFEFNNGSF